MSPLFLLALLTGPLNGEAFSATQPGTGVPVTSAGSEPSAVVSPGSPDDVAAIAETKLPEQSQLNDEAGSSGTATTVPGTELESSRRGVRSVLDPRATDGPLASSEEAPPVLETGLRHAVDNLPSGSGEVPQASTRHRLIVRRIPTAGLDVYEVEIFDLAPRREPLAAILPQIITDSRLRSGHAQDTSKGSSEVKRKPVESFFSEKSSTPLNGK